MKDIEEKELDQFEVSLRDYVQGRINFETFRKIRVWQGIYTFRGTTDQYMIRIKVPQGQLHALQLEQLADLAQKHSLNERVHITTRQGLELYAVGQTDLMKVLRSLAEAGLTTRETGGNGVRNVTACAFTGVSPEEPFDVTPYAKSVSQYFLRNSLTQNLPRKVKIAFESCPVDHVHAMIQDIGAFAATQDNIPGFQLFVGGGLGGVPRAGELLEDFTPAIQLLATIESILRVFNEYGGRQNRDRARLKYLLKDWGIERFRKTVLTQRNKTLREGRVWPELENSEPAFLKAHMTSCEVKADPNSALARFEEQDDPAFKRWLSHNVYRQKQSGFSSVFVRCPLGDISADQVKKVAEVSRQFCQGLVRTTITQNLLLPWIHLSDLANLYRALQPAGLALCCAEHVMDITRCAGADSCLSAITYSRGLASELGKLFSNGLSQDPELFDLVIKISGCPHACGQHPIADLGFHGASKTIAGRQVPHYQILLGGYTERGKAQFARPTLLIPAKKIPLAVSCLLKFYLKNRMPSENFRNFLGRLGLDQIRNLLIPLTLVPSYEQDPEIYKDWGSNEDYRLQAGRGECSA